MEERHREGRKTQLDKKKMYTNKEIGHKHKHGHIQSERKCEWLRKKRESGRNRVIECRVGTNIDESRHKHIESGHKKHKQEHKQSCG